MSFLWFLQGLRTPALTAFFRFITFFGEEYLVVVIIALLYWCMNKRLARGLAMSFFVSTLIIQGLKIALRVDRPWIADPAFAPVEAVLATATGYSFPSGHTQTAASLFGYLGLASGKKKWIILSWLFVALVGLSRMYLGVHTPLDVVAAMAIALVVALVSLRLERANRADGVLTGALVALSAVVLIYAQALYSRAVIDAHYLSDCYKAAGGCVGCAIGLLWAKRAIPFGTGAPRPWQQAVKLVAGLAVLLAIKEGLKLVLPTLPAMDALRYFLIAIWALALYPMIFSRALRATE